MSQNFRFTENQPTNQPNKQTNQPTNKQTNKQTVPTTMNPNIATQFQCSRRAWSLWVDYWRGKHGLHKKTSKNEGSWHGSVECQLHWDVVRKMSRNMLWKVQQYNSEGNELFFLLQINVNHTYRDYCGYLWVKIIKNQHFDWNRKTSSNPPWSSE